MSGVSQVDFAREMGYAKSYVTALKKNGRLVFDEHGKVMVEASKKRIEQTADGARADVKQRHARARAREAAFGGSRKNTERETQEAETSQSQIGESYQKARAVKEKFLALQAKLDYEVAASKYLSTESVVATVSRAAISLRTNLESLSVKISALLAMTQDEPTCRAIINDAVEDLLRDVEHEFANLARLGSKND